MTNNVKILVSGARGAVGSQLTKQLLKMDIPFRILVRDPAKVENLDAKIERAVGDLDKPDTLEKAMDGIESIFLLTGNNQQDRNVIDAALKSGCRKIVKLSTFEAGLIPLKGPGQWHHEREELIKASGLDWTFLRPTMMATVTLVWKHSIKANGVVIFPGGAGKVSPIHPADVADVAFAALTTENHNGKAYQLTGSELLSMGDMTNILSKVLGKPLQYNEQSSEEVIEAMLKVNLPKYLAEGLAETYRGLKAGDFAICTEYVKQITGHQPSTFESWCEENVEVFK